MAAVHDSNMHLHQWVHFTLCFIEQLKLTAAPQTIREIFLFNVVKYDHFKKPTRRNEWTIYDGESWNTSIFSVFLG
jgi:hypothetical protein